MKTWSLNVVKFVWLWWTISIFLGAPGLAAEEQSLQFDDIIRMLDHSGKKFNYLGTKFVIDFTPSRRSTTLVKVTYGASGLEKKEVSPLQRGESQIILDDGKYLWHYIPSQASVVKRKRQVSLGEISRRIHQQNELIQQNYHIDIEKLSPSSSTATVDQIPSVTGDVMVTFQPKTKDRPAWKIWLDSEHGLVVRTEIYDINGNLTLLSAFSELTFQAEISKSSFKITVPKGTKMRTSIEKHFQTLEEAEQAIDFPISRPGYLPEGFMLAAVIYSQSQQREKVQLAYIDGLSSISIFEEKRDVSSETPTEPSKEVEINNAVKGTFHDQGLLKILNWQLNTDLQLTLVGEVADTELLKIASSFRQ
jgi:outer membrane lipoprotein-sorting protein